MLFKTTFTIMLKTAQPYKETIKSGCIKTYSSEQTFYLSLTQAMPYIINRLKLEYLFEEQLAFRFY